MTLVVGNVQNIPFRTACSVGCQYRQDPVLHVD